MSAILVLDPSTKSWSRLRRTPRRHRKDSRSPLETATAHILVRFHTRPLPRGSTVCEAIPGPLCCALQPLRALQGLAASHEEFYSCPSSPRPLRFNRCTMTEISVSRRSPLGMAYTANLDSFDIHIVLKFFDMIRVMNSNMARIPPSHRALEHSSKKSNILENVRRSEACLRCLPQTQSNVTPHPSIVRHSCSTIGPLQQPSAV